MGQASRLPSATHIPSSRATPGASSRLLNIEDIPEHQLHILHRHYAELAHLAKQDHDLTKSHSIEEADRRHSKKSGAGKEEPA